MAEVARALEKKLPGVIKTSSKVTRVRKLSDGGFDIALEQDGQVLNESASFAVFATGQESLKKIVPEINVDVLCTKTRGVIIEARCPQYKKYDILLFSKHKNRMVHGMR
jgi:hypothetical protein